MFTFPISLYGPSVQELTITSTNNLVLTSHTPFTDLNKNIPIKVYLSGNFYGTSTGVYGVDLGDLSTWNQVDVELLSGGVIGGHGGNGGNSSNGTGGSGGTGLNINAANSSANVSFVNNGTIRGGGGGGGGGVRQGITDYGLTGGKSPTCTSAGITVYGGGGGGGGGRTHTGTSGGGGATVSTEGCAGSSPNGVGGGAGSSAGPGGGGAGGSGRYNPSHLSSTCSTCLDVFGGAGGSGGAWGTAGNNGTNGAGGAAGFSLVNRDHCAWTNNGTLTGPQGA